MAVLAGLLTLLVIQVVAGLILDRVLSMLGQPIDSLLGWLSLSATGIFTGTIAGYVVWRISGVAKGNARKSMIVLAIIWVLLTGATIVNSSVNDLPWLIDLASLSLLGLVVAVLSCEGCTKRKVTPNS
jgi:hypothetical protein